MVGYAVTCTADSTTPGPKRPNRLHDLLDALAAAPKPAVVAIQNVGPDPARSCFVGDMICTAYHRLGAVGVVTDGGLRDLSGIQQRAPGFQVFAPGVVVSHGAGVKLDINVPVRIGGLDIRPGDLLHGDESGLLVVPLDIAQSVVVRARRVREEEAEILDFLGSPAATLEGIKLRLSG